MVSSINSNLASAWANNLFAQLDTQNQGYIDKAGLESALSKISDSSTSAEDVFTRLDSNNDGKITKDEMSAALENMFSKLGSGSGDMRMHGGPDGPPPPKPPDGNDTGFTKEELASQLDEIGSSDDKRAALISNIIKNFDAADTNGDGKVSFEEAMAYDQAHRTDTTGAAASGGAAASTDTSNNEANVTMQIMKLLQAYDVLGNGSSQSASVGQFSASA
jgi:Ca2+-binding EF-hand superfamily protein